MSIIRVELAEEFMLGDDIVLLAMDGDGVAEFTAALKRAEDQGSWELERGSFSHRFTIRAGQSTVDLQQFHVDWSLDQGKAVEIIDALNSLADGGCPGHQYVDISQPVSTLLLSLDEYV